MKAAAKIFPTLYKQSSTGKAAMWCILASEEKDGAAISTTFGYVDGKQQTTTVKVKEGKNLGKANATTPYEQAKAEAESKWKKQLDKGYVESLAGVKQAKAERISPMLAHSYDDYAHKVVWPCHYQPKLDGVRCLAYRIDGKIALMSRQGKPFKSMGHIAAEVESLISENETCVLDGELYVHGEEFQELIHLIKRDEPAEGSEKIEYHVYDMYDPADLSLTFAERHAKLRYKMQLLGNSSKIKPVKTAMLRESELLSVPKAWAKVHGYEGIMLRNAGAVYRPGHRSQDLLKVKEFQDKEYEIVGGYENKVKAEKPAKIEDRRAHV